MDVLSGHENDVNYVQFSGCSAASKFSVTDTLTEENLPKFKNSWFTRDNIVTCSRDGSAIIWVPKSRRSHSKVGRWSRAYHLKVPPPPMAPQPLRGGPRQRHLPTPRGVNMIVWSLDNRFVLAAIMDCRICVWNAVDGSLVHCLTGHSESTYVLDVHPFNPRVAMSAGYDGKTIVWDIWEGTPIRIYETGRFKLVDGKFSPDGTSIILSDDVGQIYILSTGQGESQKESKYDQFFLGDYRALIQDTHGNVLDQETQLAPYWRNIQDLLCDSSMMPYPEPYQSMYQRRRLGALGIERRHSSVNFAVGPVDVNSIQDFQMFPLPDLDRINEPLPEFLDAMDWEPEIEYHSDDNDSEYNVTDELPSEGERRSPGTSSCSDSECSAEDNDAEQSLEDGLRRSKRRKHKKVELMTSSGRLVKRRNLDVQDGISSLNNRTWKTRNKNKSLKRKPSASKSSRPQREAARNARHWLSRIKGACTDEDTGTSEDELSGEESMLADSNTQSSESGRSIQNVQQKNLKGKEAFLDEVDTTSELRSLTNARKKKLVLKLPGFESKPPFPTESTRTEEEELVNLCNLSPETKENDEVNWNRLSFQDPGSSSSNLMDAVLSYNEVKDMLRVREQSDKAEDHMDLSTRYKEDKMKWGEVRARTSKRLRYGDANLRSNANRDDHNEVKNYVNEHFKPEREYRTASHLVPQNNGDETVANAYKQQCIAGTSSGARNKEVTLPDDVHEALVPEQSSLNDNRKERGESLVRCDGNLNTDSSGPVECRGYDDSLGVINSNGLIESAFRCKNEIDRSQEVQDVRPPIYTKLRIISKKTWEDPVSSSEPSSLPAVEDRTSPKCDLGAEGPSRMRGNLVTSEENECNHRSNLENGDGKRFDESESQGDIRSSVSGLQDLKISQAESKSRMFSVVYKRSKSRKVRASIDNNGVDLEEHTLNVDNNLDPRMEFPEATADGVCRTRSMAIKATTTEMDNNFKNSEDHRSVDASRSAEKFGVNACEELVCEKWGLNSKVRVGLRSARNRRANYHGGDLTSLSKRKPPQSPKKWSWLMLSEPEDNYRYIPQLGDNVAYLRQGHEGYLEWCRRLKEKGPWTKFEGLRAVEFCKVEALDYSTCTGSGESCCKITLDFVDPSSSVFCQTFKLTLPELNDFSDFLVEKTRFDASMNRQWSKRDKCQVWWRNEDGEGGSWYYGRIVAVQPGSPMFPDSPWERYAIQYKGDADQHLHSPWELHESDTPWVHPHIDYELRNKLLSLVEKLEQHGIRNQDRYGLLKLRQVSQKPDFLNRFPVPLTLDVIQSRLDHNYYRKLEAVKHDFTVMLSNAQSYFPKNEALNVKLRRLSEWFNEKILPL